MFSFTGKSVCAHNRRARPCGNGKSNQAKIMQNVIFFVAKM